MRGHSKILLALALALALCSPVFAQGAVRVNVAGSYALLRDKFEGDGQGNLPVGWLAALSARLKGPIWVAGELGANHKTTDLGIHKTGAHVFSYLAGVKLCSEEDAPAALFAQLLIGGVSGSEMGPSELTSGLALQPGVGVDIMLAQKVGVRIQADYRYISESGYQARQFRFATGFVITLARDPGHQRNPL